MAAHGGRYDHVGVLTDIRNIQNIEKKVTTPAAEHEEELRRQLSMKKSCGGCGEHEEQELLQMK